MKLVTIKKIDQHYPHYKEWVDRVSYKHAHLYIKESAPQKDRVYLEIISAEHSYKRRDTLLSLIQDLITKQVYIVNSNALFDLTTTFEVGPQNSTIMGISPLTVQEVINMLERRVNQVEEDLSHQNRGSQMIYRAVEINLLDRVIDSFTDVLNLDEIILYTAEDVQHLIDEITDEADVITEHVLNITDLTELESPIMDILKGK